MTPLSTSRRHKYGAKPKTVDGIRFASTKEAYRYQELKWLEKAGQVHDIRWQQAFELAAFNRGGGLGHPIGKYIADFVYCMCLRTPCVRSQLVVEDVKSPATRTELYKWKKKHVEAQFGITIHEL